MSEIKYTELDFAKIKENLKAYLKSQSKFRDYDFEASGLSILLDILAYNTAYNGFYLNMLASEMFLDSAYMRENVVSRAKHLGYTPSSRRALSAVVDIEFDFSDPSLQSASPGNPFLVEVDDEFYCLVNSSRHVFYPKFPVLAQQSGLFKFVAKDVVLIEGKRLTYSWVVDSTTKSFVIPNGNIDLSTLLVYVSPNESSTQKIRYTEFKDLTELTPNDEIYFVQETLDNKFELIFGDGALGKSIQKGNVVYIEYVVPTSDNAAGSDKFYLSSAKMGTFVQKTQEKLIPKEALSAIVTKVSARDYAEKEGIESIKFKAPKAYAAQNRAVTMSDYDVLLKKDISIINPKIEHIRVWGGEENNPPEYGKVFFAIKPSYGVKLNEQEKVRIIENYIRPKNMISVEPVILEPDYIGLIISTTVNYYASRTKNSEVELKSFVYDAIKQFRDINILGFDSDLRHSKLSAHIDLVDSSIQSNITQLTMKYRITPELTVPFTKIIPLSNAVSKGDILNGVNSVSSTTFVYANTNVILGDDGQGNLVLYKSESLKKTPMVKVGTINYTTGDLYITRLIADSIPNNLNYIDIFVTPAANDVIAYKNQIIIIENQDIKVSCLNLDYVRTS